MCMSAVLDRRDLAPPGRGIFDSPYAASANPDGASQCMLSFWSREDRQGAV